MEEQDRDRARNRPKEVQKPRNRLDLKPIVERRVQLLHARSELSNPKEIQLKLLEKYRIQAGQLQVKWENFKLQKQREREKDPKNREEKRELHQKETHDLYPFFIDKNTN